MGGSQRPIHVKKMYRGQLEFLEGKRGGGLENISFGGEVWRFSGHLRHDLWTGFQGRGYE